MQGNVNERVEHKDFIERTQGLAQSSAVAFIFGTALQSEQRMLLGSDCSQDNTVFVYGGNQDLCIFFPWQTVTKITPGFQLGPGTLTKLRFTFFLLSRGCLPFLVAASRPGSHQDKDRMGSPRSLTSSAIRMPGLFPT